MTTALGRYRMLDLSRQLPGAVLLDAARRPRRRRARGVAPTDPMGIGIPLLERNKRSMTLNLKTPEGREIFQRLVRDADVILEGFRPGVTERLGIDYETLRAINPRLVYCSISGYGQDGPYRDQVGHDINYLGYAGVLDVSAPPAARRRSWRADRRHRRRRADGDRRHPRRAARRASRPAAASSSTSR